MAEQLLPMFQPKPLTMPEIINLLRSPEYDYLTYKKLDEPKLQEIWDQKCAPKIGKVAAKTLTYNLQHLTNHQSPKEPNPCLK
jgi:hypothetical protein